MSPASVIHVLLTVERIGRKKNKDNELWVQTGWTVNWIAEQAPLLAALASVCTVSLETALVEM
jgi:hypothetical protein